jgi:bifunctional DNA-binding transcriptional regulator/antitoxin component of YhaV-PrlF toxin-antitoxin module
MDRVGRVVLPKALRDQLGLLPNAELDAMIDGTAIRLEPRPADERQLKVVEGWPVIAAGDAPVVTDEAVRARRDGDQR